MTTRQQHGNHIDPERRLIHLMIRYLNSVEEVIGAGLTAQYFDRVHQPLVQTIFDEYLDSDRTRKMTREHYLSTLSAQGMGGGVVLAMRVYDKCNVGVTATPDDLGMLRKQVIDLYTARCCNVLFEEFHKNSKRVGEHEAVAMLRSRLDAFTASSTQALKVKTLRAEDAETISWLWHKRFALGKLGIIAGEPGQGKGLISCYIASRVTTGEAFVDADQPTPKGDVLFLSAEDNYRDTIIPRLIVAGADLDGGHVHVVESVSTNNGNDTCVDLNRDIPALESHLQQHPQIRLIIIDPLSAYMGKVNSWQDTQVRSILQPLCKMAENHNVAVIGIMHLNKDEKKKSAVNRAAGSIGFIGAARTAWLVCDDKYDGSKMFLCIKTNVSARPEGLGYDVCVKSDRPYVVWRAGELAVTAHEALQEAKTPQAKETAREWLLDLLGDGQVKSQEVYDAADKAGVAVRTLKRAKADLDVIAKKQGNVWYWSLREEESADVPLGS